MTQRQQTTEERKVGRREIRPCHWVKKRQQIAHFSYHEDVWGREVVEKPWRISFVLGSDNYVQDTASPVKGFLKSMAWHGKEEAGLDNRRGSCTIKTNCANTGTYVKSPMLTLQHSTDPATATVNRVSILKKSGAATTNTNAPYLGDVEYRSLGDPEACDCPS